MNWADWAIIIIFALSCVIGLIRGFVREALSLVIWLCAALVARLFGEQLAVLLIGHIETPSVRLMSAYAILFVATLLVGAILNYIVGALIAATGLSGTDRLLGMIFGAVRAFIIVMVILILLPGFLPVHEDEWWHQSQLIPHFLRCEDWSKMAYETLSQMLSSLFAATDSKQSI